MAATAGMNQLGWLSARKKTLVTILGSKDSDDVSNSIDTK